MDITRFLSSAKDGDPEARARVIEATYHELRRLAIHQMRAERPDHTLTATALVNEVAMKMLNETEVSSESRGQFLAYAARAMRNLLIDHARTKGRQKRGADYRRVEFREAVVACQEQSDEFLALNDALETLSGLDTRQAQVVEMRYFGGMSNQEVATALDISVATVKRDWQIARTWLARELSRDKDGSGANE